MRKKKQTGIIIGVTILLMIVLWTAYAYLLQKVLELPIDLPFKQQEVLQDSDISEVEPTIETWYNTIIFTPKQELEVEAEPTPDVETKFDSVLNTETLDNYLDGHVNATSDGNDKLFFDAVTLENTPTGVKTSAGDDIYAIDNVDGIMIAGTVLETGSRIKLAFVNQDADLDLSVVDDLNYWVEIEESAKNAQAILAINASDYTWNYSYDCGKLTGLLKRHGDLIRRAEDENLVVGFDKEHKMIIGSTVDMFSGVESKLVLVRNGENVYQTSSVYSETDRQARTIMGQLKDGTVVFAVADMHGGGATIPEMLDILSKYELDNAVMLGSGNRTAIYWNGRVVVELEDEDGLKLPDLWVVKSIYVQDDNNDKTAETETTEDVVDDNALEIK